VRTDDNRMQASWLKENRMNSGEEGEEAVEAIAPIAAGCRQTAPLAVAISPKPVDTDEIAYI